MRSPDFFRTAPLEDLRVIRKRAVLALLGLSDTRLRALEADGKFPKHFALGDNSVAWLERDVRDWLASRTTKAVKPSGIRVQQVAAKKARGRA